MNPELEALVRAYDAVTLANSADAPAALQRFDTLLDDLSARHPHLDRERLLRAVHLAHRRWVRAQDKPPTMPPQG